MRRETGAAIDTGGGSGDDTPTENIGLSVTLDDEPDTTIDNGESLVLSYDVINTELNTRELNAALFVESASLDSDIPLANDTNRMIEPFNSVNYQFDVPYSDLDRFDAGFYTLSFRMGPPGEALAQQDAILIEIRKEGDSTTGPSGEDGGGTETTTEEDEPIDDEFVPEADDDGDGDAVNTGNGGEDTNGGTTQPPSGIDMVLTTLNNNPILAFAGLGAVAYAASKGGK